MAARVLETSDEAQLNVHVPGRSNLLASISTAAADLGLSDSALARAVLEVALNPFVAAQREVRRIE